MVIKGKSRDTRAKTRMNNTSTLLPITRYFAKTGRNAHGYISWEKSDVRIIDEEGNVKFEQRDVEFPDSFSELARRVVSQKYFYGEQGTSEREYSIKQVVDRIADAISEQGVKQGYFDKKNQEIFRSELAYLMLDQRMAFNSPVEFNVGTNKYESRKTDKPKNGWIISDRNQTITLETKMGEAKFKVKKGNAIPLPKGAYHEYPQTSACFIQGLEDTMEDIMRLAVSEAMLFKQGSGTGTDLSTLRSSREKLSGGGRPSGPLAYLRFYDRVAAIVKSGGKTRRAAKMNSLKMNHPDIKEFINAKRGQEWIIRTLVAAGMNADDAADVVSYQNVNLSVRATDEFMHAVENGKKWKTHPINNKEMENEMPEYPARELFEDIARGTYECGDPGMQFHDTINKWHTCPNSGSINASNPCSEYMFLDDSSCNLASHKLTKYRREDGSFDTKSFVKTIQLTTIAQDLLYDFSSFPEKEIAENSHRFRPLGMGYADLGSLIMQSGMSYDSDEARTLASAVSSLMTASVYEESARMAKKLGAFEEFENNREPMMKVIEMHRNVSNQIDKNKLPERFWEIADEANKRWEIAIKLGRKYGFRNAQATVIAPTGTISFMMDCDTTGIEPDTALVKYKLLAGGGMLKIVNKSVAPSLKTLGYNDKQIRDILLYVTGHQKAEGAPHLREEDYEKVMKNKNKIKILEGLGYDTKQKEDILCYIDGHETIEGAPHLREEHLLVFDCAFKASRGKRYLSPESHLKMMTAVQPFISGAISKTINVNEETTPEKIGELYMEGWKLGLKAVAIYRRGTKVGQPVTTGPGGLEEKVGRGPHRRRLPDTRNSITHKFSVAGHEGYMTVGLYEDKTPGELFITMAKEGSTVGGLTDVIGTCTSMALQYGVPLETLCDKFRNARFEPAGMTSNKEIPFAKSLIDYIFTWLQFQFIGKDKKTPTAHELSSDELTTLAAITNTETGKGAGEGNDKSHGKLCVCGNIFQPRFCGDLCPTCYTPDYTGCEGGPG